MKRVLALMMMARSVTAFGADAPVPSSAAWPEKMQGMRQVLTEILEDVSNDDRFASPDRKEPLEKNAKKLSELAHSINASSADMVPDADPSVRLMSGLFAEEADRAYKELKRGHRPYARMILRTISSYCIGCHTRNNSGPAFSGPALGKVGDSLSAVSRAELLVATRQFDPAVDELMKAVNDQAFAREKPLEWERAVRQALILSVRVKESPDLGLKVVGQALANSEAPFYLRAQAEKWKESLDKWKAEGPRPAKRSEKDMFAETKRLYDEARKMQRYPADRIADVLFLRASASVHNLLQAYPSGEKLGDTLLHAGMVYRVLRDLELTTLHELYFMACIKNSPHTPIARQCFQQYEESIYFGYTGSGGLELPPEVLTRIKALEALSRPANNQVKAKKN